MAVDLGTARGRIEIDAKGVFTSMEAAGKSINKFQSRVTTAMVGVGIAVGAATTAVGLMKKGWEAVERGTELQLIESRFNRLADSIGSSGDALMSRLESATNGMMTNAQLMESATSIMSLGLGKTEDQTVRLATVVSKLGWDMQQVVLTFANNSKLRLDALGLSLEDVTKRAKELEEQGYSTDAAFDMAVIEAGEAKIELLGDQSQTTAGKIKIMKAAVQEAQDEFARGAAEGFAEALDAITSSAALTGDALSDASRGAGDLIGRWAGSYLMSYFGSDLAILIDRGRELEETQQNLEQQLAVSDDGLAAWAGTVEDAGDNTRDFNHMTLRAGVALIIAGERFKEAAAGSGKFGDSLDGLKAKAAAAKAELDAAAERATAYATAFGAVQADYVTERPEADEPLVTPEQTVTVRTRISGPTAEQAALAQRYRDELERLRETYGELTSGLGTFGMEQGKLDEAIAQTAGEIAHYETLLAGIPPAVDDVASSQQGLAVNVDAVRQAVYDQLVRIEAAPEVITAYATATGIMSEAQAEAALQAAAVKVKIEELATQIAEGMPIDQALADLDAFIAKIEGGAVPAADTLATEVPQALAPMSEEMSTQATTAGESVPANIATGIETTLSEATEAAAAAGLETAAAVAAGIEEGTPDTEAVMEAMGAAALDAWQPTVDEADAIGGAMIDGVIAGAEANRGALEAKMAEIARAAYESAMTELQAQSPSRLFMEMGESIIGGIVAGLDEEKDTLYGAMADIADELYGVATAGLAWLGDPLAMQLDAQDDLIRDLAGQVEAALEPFGLLGLRLGADVTDRLRGMELDQLRSSLYGLRYSNEYMTTPAVAAEVERLIALADERAAAEAELLRIQEEAAEVEERRLALEEERARLDFLQAQIDLVNTVRELGLSTSILEGLELGLDANAEDLVEAMRQVIARLIEAAEDELEIASPSRVGYGLMANFMDAMTRGIAENSRDPVDALADTYDAMLALEGRMTAAGLRPVGSGGGMGAAGVGGAAELRQNVTIFGGYNVALEGQPSADPLRELYFARLGYQGA